MKVLLCDDDAVLRRSFSNLLRGHFEAVVTDGPDGMQSLSRERFDVIVTDLRMPEVDGFAILNAARRQQPDTPVLILTGAQEVPSVVRAMREGARDYLVKPFAVPALLDAITRASRPPAAPSPEADLDPFAWRDRFAPRMLGASPAMATLFGQLARAAATDLSVLLQGETGTGKELAAAAIRDASERSNRPYLAVNCATYGSALVASELFGHARGAYTGATERRAGHFVTAHRGTLFLDEIGEMDLAVQAQLLRTVETGEVIPVGADAPQRADVRIIAASRRDLPAEACAGRFRDDLYWRLSVLKVALPPLRDRRGDIPLLVDALLRKVAAELGRPRIRLASRALDVLEAHAWPGNIRELRNTLYSLVALHRADVLDIDHLPDDLREATPRSSLCPDSGSPGELRGALQRVEDELIDGALARHQGNRTRAAADLGISRPSLIAKLKARGDREPCDGR
jgi:DNA-binding NtrC family response regulator